VALHELLGLVLVGRDLKELDELRRRDPGAGGVLGVARGKDATRVRQMAAICPSNSLIGLPSASRLATTSA
jgi:hypothetical protein